MYNLYYGGTEGHKKYIFNSGPRLSISGPRLSNTTHISQ